MRRLEVSVETSFTRWIGRWYPEWHCLKFKPPGSDGWPDRILVGPEQSVMFIEFKREGEEPEPLQQERIVWLVDRGHYVTVCRSVDEAQGDFTDYLLTKGLPRGKH